MPDTEDQDRHGTHDEMLQKLDFWSGVVSMAINDRKVIYIEGYVCPKCSTPTFRGHMGIEVVTCVKCGHRQPSIAPAPKARGEVTAAHYQQAIIFLHTQMAAVQKGGLDPITPAEMEHYDSTVRTFLSRNHVEVTKNTAAKIADLAKELAALDE